MFHETSLNAVVDKCQLKIIGAKKLCVTLNASDAMPGYDVAQLTSSKTEGFSSPSFDLLARRS
jgi:hypothetical protein